MIAATPEGRARIRQAQLERLRTGNRSARRRRLNDLGVTHLPKDRRRTPR